jgi:hypothetical protein
VLRGSETPRLWTRPLRRLTRRTSLGYRAIEFIEEFLGVELLPWQKWWLIHALELNPGGGLRFRTVVTLVARQNGKTTLLKCLALFFMFDRGVRLVLGSAQSLDIAREAWQGAVELAEADPELRGEIETVRRANGEQELRLANGARYRITASTRSAGRGLSVDLLILDELREHRDWLAWGALSKTTQARPHALTVAISNAGDDDSTVLNALRDTALAETDPTLGIFEWSAPDGCDLDDRQAWAQANPGLGYTIGEQAIASSLSTDPPAVFRTEVLCQRVDTLDSAVSVDAWKACHDPASTMDALRDRVAVCLDLAPDQQHATLVACAIQGDGRARLEVVESWDGPNTTARLRAELPGLLAAVKPRVVGWYPGGPAAALAVDLRAVKGSTELKAADVPTVCQALAEQVTARRVIHPGDALLTAHVTQSRRLYSGDGWRFVRRGVGHVDAAYAAAGALHLARTLPAPMRPRVILPRSA